MTSYKRKFDSKYLKNLTNSFDFEDNFPSITSPSSKNAAQPMTPKNNLVMDLNKSFQCQKEIEN